METALARVSALRFVILMARLSYSLSCLFFFFIPLLNPYSCLISQSMLKYIKLHKVNVSLIDFEKALEKKK